MIISFKKLSVWFGKSPSSRSCCVFPRCSYFNGGCYFKFSLYFWKYILEFSHPKKDKTIYETVSKAELNKILADIGNGKRRFKNIKAS